VLTLSFQDNKDGAPPSARTLIFVDHRLPVLERVTRTNLLCDDQRLLGRMTRDPKREDHWFLGAGRVQLRVDWDSGPLWLGDSTVDRESHWPRRSEDPPCWNDKVTTQLPARISRYSCGSLCHSNIYDTSSTVQRYQWVPCVVCRVENDRRDAALLAAASIFEKPEQK
jgi:hypothetical protein